MSYTPQITLEVEGIEGLVSLIEKALKLSNELQSTVDEMRVERLRVQAKINQPTAGAKDLERLESGEASMNEIRGQYGMTPIDGGDIHLCVSQPPAGKPAEKNMSSADLLKEAIQRRAVKAKKAEEDETLARRIFDLLKESGVSVSTAERALDRAKILVRAQTTVGN